MRILSVIGPPGSGKTTVAQKLASHFNAHYLSTGKLARDLAVEDVKVAEALDRGEMAPPDLMDRHVVKAIDMLAEHCPLVVLDGYPRYMEQLATIQWMAYDTNFVVINCDTVECLRRVSTRWRDSGDGGGPFMARMRHWTIEGTRVVEWLEDWHPEATVVVPAGMTRQDMLDYVVAQTKKFGIMEEEHA